MIDDNTPTFDDVLTQALRLPPDERLAIIEALAASFRRDQPRPAGIEQTFTDDEIAALLRPEPLAPAEIIAQGLTGTWAEADIRSGSEWVNEQKHKRRERRQW